MADKAHMGAGAITSNVKSDKSLVVIRDLEGDLYPTGCKGGRLMGDLVVCGLQRRPEPRNRHRPAQQHPTSCVRAGV